MSSPQLNKIKSIIAELPPLPTSISKILEMSKKMNINANELYQVISLDPVLTGKVLKLVNSAYFSLPNKVTSLVQSIVLLGINTVKNIALSTTISPFYSNEKMFSKLPANSYWKHCLSVGTVAKEIAVMKSIDKQLHEEYFIAGIIHDIGKIVLSSCYKEEYFNLIYKSEKVKESLEITETKQFGINHLEVGIMIAQTWNLSSDLMNAIGMHHNEDEIIQGASQFLKIIYAANSITKHLEIGFAGNKIYDFNKMVEVFNQLMINFDKIIAKENEIKQKIKNAEVFLKIGEDNEN